MHDDDDDNDDMCMMMMMMVMICVCYDDVCVCVLRKIITLWICVKMSFKICYNMFPKLFNK